MGYMRHHAILVTSWYPERLEDCRAVALDLFATVGQITEEGINGHASFFIPPDGSKEGWPKSINGDDRRAAFVKYLRAEYRDEEGASLLDWVEVQYGDDNGETRICRHSDEELAEECPE